MLELKNDIKLTRDMYKELYNIIEIYKKNYPDYNEWGKKKKSDFFDKENNVRINLDLYENNVGNDNIGYLKNICNFIILDDNFIKLMFIRINGLKSCIYNQELYLNENKIEDTCNEQKYLDFFNKELKKLESLYFEYEQNMVEIEKNKEKKIQFVKKICYTINWGFEDNFSTCDELKKKKDLHPKTYEPYKQRVLGSVDSDFAKFRLCNKYFEGIMLRDYENKANFKNGILTNCDKTVEWSILLNKYAVLSSYYKKAPFIRFLLLNELIMPYRRFPPVKQEDKKGDYIGDLIIGPYEYQIYKEKEQLSYEKKRVLFKYFTLYDKNNFKINPPLLRSSITVTYTEFRDLLCYLNLPVFRSTASRNMLFFPNYDLHQRLLEIQGLPRNYDIYTGRNIEWKWFKEGEVSADEWEAQQKIEIFCEEFKESEGYGIKPVQYEWYEITFETGNKKKYIFLVCTRKEHRLYYSNLEYLEKNNKYYVYNDVIREHALKKLNEEYRLVKPDSFWREKYLKYKIKYLELKNK
jgi:hypothetical protein